MDEGLIKVKKEFDASKSSSPSDEKLFQCNVCQESFETEGQFMQLLRLCGLKRS